MNKDIIFEAKAVAVPYNYRISYKVSLICLIINMCCMRGGCSSAKIHMINVAIGDKEVQGDIIKLVEGRYLMSSIPLRFDPSVNRALNYALSDELILRQANGNFRLTNRGKALVEKIKEDDNLLIVEKMYLNSLKYRLTEEIIAAVSKDWGIKNV